MIQLDWTINVWTVVNVALTAVLFVTRRYISGLYKKQAELAEGSQRAIAALTESFRSELVVLTERLIHLDRCLDEAKRLDAERHHENVVRLTKIETRQEALLAAGLPRGGAG